MSHPFFNKDAKENLLQSGWFQIIDFISRTFVAVAAIVVSILAYRLSVEINEAQIEPVVTTDFRDSIVHPTALLLFNEGVNQISDVRIKKYRFHSLVSYSKDPDDWKYDGKFEPGDSTGFAISAHDLQSISNQARIAGSPVFGAQGFSIRFRRDSDKRQYFQTRYICVSHNGDSAVYRIDYRYPEMAPNGKKRKYLDSLIAAFENR